MTRSQSPRSLPRNRNNFGLLSLSQWCPVSLPPSHAVSAVCVPTDPNILSLSGKVLPSCDLARRYGLRDVDGKSSSPATSLPSVSCSSSSLDPFLFLLHILLSVLSPREVSKEQ